MSDQTMFEVEAPGALVMNLVPDEFTLGQSPLAGSVVRGNASDSISARIVLRERRLLDHLTFRCQSTPNQKQVFEHIMGCALPVTPLVAVSTDVCTIRWLSPDEWLITVPPGAAFGLETAFRATMPGHYSLVNGSGGLTVFQVTGPSVVDLLKKCVSVDIHLSVFPVNKVVSTNFAKATCVLHRTTDDAFELIVRRSFADYIWRWLSDAADEFGFWVEP
jgi:sarcosine oxidase subunit gamma